MSYERSKQQKQHEAQMGAIERALFNLSNARTRLEKEIAALEQADAPAYMIDSLRRAHDELGETHARAMQGTYFHVSDEDMASARAQRQAAEARIASRSRTERASTDVVETAAQGSLL